MKFLSFMTKVNPNNGNETQLNIFSLDIYLNLIAYLFLWKDIKVF